MLHHHLTISNLYNQATHLQLVHHLLQVHLVDLSRDDIHHSFADVLALRALRIRCFLYLVGLPLGEANAEYPEQVAICCLHINYGLNHCLDTKFGIPEKEGIYNTHL